MHKVPDNQEVVDIAHARNDADFIVQTLQCFLRRFIAVAVVQTVHAELPEISGGVCYTLCLVLRELDHAELKFNFASCRDL